MNQFELFDAPKNPVMDAVRGIYAASTCETKAAL